jgi:hypothetical protein
MRQSIRHAFPVAAGSNQVGVSKDAEMVREQVLRDSEALVDLFDLPWARQQDLNNGEACGICQSRKFRSANVRRPIGFHELRLFIDNILGYNAY